MMEMQRWTKRGTSEWSCLKIFIKVLLKLNAKISMYWDLIFKLILFYLASSMRVDPKTGSFFMIPRFIRSSTFGLRRKNFRSFSRIFNFSFTIGAVTTAGDSRPALLKKEINFLIFYLIRYWSSDVPAQGSAGNSTKKWVFECPSAAAATVATK